MTENKEVVLVEVTTQTAPAFKLPDEKDLLDANGMLVRIYNKLIKIEDSLK